MQDGRPLLEAGRAGLPTLIIEATKDLCITQGQVEKELEGFSDLTIKRIDAGHIAFYDAFDETIEAIANFVGKYAVRDFALRTFDRMFNTATFSNDINV